MKLKELYTAVIVLTFSVCWKKHTRLSGHLCFFPFTTFLPWEMRMGCWKGHRNQSKNIKHDMGICFHDLQRDKDKYQEN